MRISTAQVIAIVCCLGVMPVDAGEDCGNNSPAFPVPECRNADGNTTACPQPGSIQLWPMGFRPALPGQQLPARRDSTQWSSFTIPGADSGHELFQSVDVAGDFLYVAYNAGIQVWDIGAGNEEQPIRMLARDGWRGDFLDFPALGENDFFTDDIAAVVVEDKTLVGLSGKDTAGLTLWEHTPSPSSIRQLYQDLDNDSRQVRMIEFEGDHYAVAAGSGGIFVYNASTAQDLVDPCLDTSGSVCPGIYRGELGSFFIAHYLDVIRRGDSHYVVASAGPGLPVEIWELSDPASPGLGAQRFSGLPSGAQGLAFFNHSGNFYLAVVARVGADWELRIYGVNQCLDADGCGSLGAPVWTRPLPAVSVLRFLTYSESNGRPFLYFGLEGFQFSGSKAELLLDLSSFPAEVTEITEGGGTYFDACSGFDVDYWGDYYPGNTNGMRNVRPRIGKFNGNYFYRAAYGILDVHVREDVSLPDSIFSDGFESGDTTSWASAEP